MGLFSKIFKQLLSRADKGSSTKSATSSNKSNGNSKKKRPTSKSSISRNVSLQQQEVRSTSTNLSHSSNSKVGMSFKYNEEGRRYHDYEEVAYMLPNDHDEADRLHQQHWILRYVLQCNYHAPVTKILEEGITVLDSGCGPATWTFEMGNTYPQSKIYGIDVSRVFPENIMPANVDFVIGNIAKTLPYPDNTFEYVHQRLLFAGLTDQDWTNALKEAYRVLKPGGYIELGELNIFDLVRVGPYWSSSQQLTMQLFKSIDIPTNICNELEDRLKKAGFVDIVLQIIPIPLNHGGKRGELMWSDLRHAIMNMKAPMASVKKEFEDPEVYEKHADTLGAEVEGYKTCINWYAVYAQKPRE